MTTILVFALILLLVVIGHEFGHFIVAKWCGVKVEEFGFGFPPKLFGYRPKGSETEYTFNWLPIGGFVRLYGEEGDHAEDTRSFAAKSPWQRIAILAAGVTVNLIIAVIAFTVVGMMGSTVLVSEESRGQVENAAVTISQVLPDSPAEQAGIKFGDRIVEVNETSVTDVQTTQDVIAEASGETIILSIERGRETLDTEVAVPEVVNGEPGKIGVGLGLAGTVRLGFWESLGQSFIRIWVIVRSTIQFIGVGLASLVTPVELPAEADVRGPVGLVQVVGDFRALGAAYIVTFVGLISTSLALFNILPIPALDGGRIVFVLVEMIKGSPVSKELENRVHMGGYVVLLGLMLLVTANDIINLVR